MSKLEAGPELDALVAEKVMEWPLDDQTAEVWFTVAPDGRVFRHDWEGRSASDRSLLKDNLRHWSPSTDIAAAWEVVPKIDAFVLRPKKNVGWQCTWRDCGDLRMHVVVNHCCAAVFADTATLAICRAALAAVEQ